MILLQSHGCSVELKFLRAAVVADSLGLSAAAGKGILHAAFVLGTLHAAAG